MQWGQQGCNYNEGLSFYLAPILLTHSINQHFISIYCLFVYPESIKAKPILGNFLLLESFPTVTVSKFPEEFGGEGGNRHMPGLISPNIPTRCF